MKGAYICVCVYIDTTKHLHNKHLSEALEYVDSTSALFPNECPGYATASDGKVPALELWGLVLLPGPLWPWVVVSVKFPFVGQIKLFNNLFYLKPFYYVQTKDWY